MLHVHIFLFSLSRFYTFLNHTTNSAESRRDLKRVKRNATLLVGLSRAGNWKRLDGRRKNTMIISLHISLLWGSLDSTLDPTWCPSPSTTCSTRMNHAQWNFGYNFRGHSSSRKCLILRSQHNEIMSMKCSILDERRKLSRAFNSNEFTIFTSLDHFHLGRISWIFSFSLMYTKHEQLKILRKYHFYLICERMRARRIEWNETHYSRTRNCSFYCRSN